MTDELRRRMARLRELAPRLNAATDQASRLVAAVEKFLVEEIRLGVSAEVAYEEVPAGADDDGRVIGIRHSLAFGRGGGSFRIHVLRETVAEGDGTSARTVLGQERILWPSCAREMKLRAFEKLPELLDRIIAEAERLAGTSEATRARVEEMIGDEAPTESMRDRDSNAAAGGTWGRQLLEAGRRYLRAERDVVEAELDGDAWEARMEAEGREDADPHDDWETARQKLIRAVCLATGHDPSQPLEAPIAAASDDWLLVVSPGRDEPWDDDDVDSRRLSVVPRARMVTVFS